MLVSKKDRETIGGHPVGESPEGLKKSLQKEKQDYVFCLEMCLRISPSAAFVVLPLDDAPPRSDFMENLEDVVSQLEFLRKRRFRSRGDVAFVKLYHPEHLRKLPFYILIAPYALMLSAAVTLCYYGVRFTCINRELLGHGNLFTVIR